MPHNELHGAAHDGRLADLAAELRTKQAGGTLAAGTSHPHPGPPPPHPGRAVWSPASGRELQQAWCLWDIHEPL